MNNLKNIYTSLRVNKTHLSTDSAQQPHQHRVDTLEIATTKNRELQATSHDSKLRTANNQNENQKKT